VGVLAKQRAALGGSVDLAITVGVDGLAAAGEEVPRGDVADGAVEAAGVVMLDEAGDDGAGLHQTRRRRCTDCVALWGLVVALDRAVGLRVVSGARIWLMPVTRMKSLNSRAMNWGPLPRMMRATVPGWSSRPRWTTHTTSRSVIDSPMSPCTTTRLQPSRWGEASEPDPRGSDAAGADHDDHDEQATLGRVGPRALRAQGQRRPAALPRVKVPLAALRSNLNDGRHLRPVPPRA
jgi:hypothetical protein